MVSIIQVFKILITIDANFNYCYW